MKYYKHRKGVALALETVVLLILSAVVLAALLGFFLGIFTPAQNEADLVKKQIKACQIAVSEDPTCKNYAAIGAKITASAGVPDFLEKVCVAQGRPGCQGAGIDSCIKSCCRAFCG